MAQVRQLSSAVICVGQTNKSVLLLEENGSVKIAGLCWTSDLTDEEIRDL